MTTTDQLLDAMGQIPTELERQYEAPEQLPDARQLALLLDGVRHVRAELSAFYKRIEQDLLAIAGEKRFVVEGLGEVSIRRSNKRTEWDHDSLTRVLVARALDERVLNESTGEYEPAHEAVARVLSECARPSWRVTPLRERGIQVDEFCHEERGEWSVMLPGKPT